MPALILAAPVLAVAAYRAEPDYRFEVISLSITWLCSSSRAACCPSCSRAPSRPRPSLRRPCQPYPPAPRSPRRHQQDAVDSTGVGISDGMRRTTPGPRFATGREVSSSVRLTGGAATLSDPREPCGSRCTGCRVRRCPVGQRVEVGYLISGKASPGERCHGWSVSTMGAPDGLLTRSRSASDQRVVIIGATAKAKATLRKGRRDRVEVVRRHLRGLVARRAGDGSAGRSDHRQGAGRSRSMLRSGPFRRAWPGTCPSLPCVGPVPRRAGRGG